MTHKQKKNKEYVVTLPAQSVIVESEDIRTKKQALDEAMQSGYFVGFPRNVFKVKVRRY